MEVSTVVGGDDASVGDVERGGVAPLGSWHEFFGSGFVFRRISQTIAQIRNALAGHSRRPSTLGSIVVGADGRITWFC